MSALFLRLSFFFVLALALVSAFDQSKFQRCRDQDWCKSLRNPSSTNTNTENDTTSDKGTLIPSEFTLVPSSWRFGRQLEFDVVSTQDGSLWTATLRVHDFQSIRLSMKPQQESQTRTPEFLPTEDILLPRAEQRTHSVQPPTASQMGPDRLTLNQNGLRITIDSAPTLRIRLSSADAPSDAPAIVVQSVLTTGRSWSSDVRFEKTSAAYGVPEHALDFALPATKATDEPIRLFNADVFEYEINNKVGLYGSIPLVMTHNPSVQGAALGMLVLNGGQMFADVAYPEGPAVELRWLAEERPIDMLLFVGDSLRSLLHTYSYFTGVHPLPQQFALGYHQCRWNYRDEEDVRAVNAEFNAQGIPMDVLWLDIEHTLGKQYFTWDPALFPQPAALQTDLFELSGRRMVTITDPHIKRVDDYHVHREATQKGHYVKAADGTTDYEGWCWSGSSSWLDFFSPSVRAWYASLFAFDVYQGSTPSLYTWIDMNEPSVFNGPEISMPKDNKHFGGYSHGQVHNLYGFYHSMAAYSGLLQRVKSTDRPFLLTRSFFAGSQRYAAVWTGDNTARWEHLRASVPMLLTLGMSGLPMVGADVGGFFGNPDSELFVRWNEMAAWQPFYRGHAHLETKRREPWLFGEENTKRVQAVIAQRYAFLPVWYTLFWEHSQSGLPPMRPVFLARGLEAYGARAADDEAVFMLGDAILVAGVFESGATSRALTLPGSSAPQNPTYWYQWPSGQRFTGSPQPITVDAPLGATPVFIRGGYVLPRKERTRRSTVAMAHDPYSLLVALSHESGSAEGLLYLDDGHSFDYTAEHGHKFSVRSFTVNFEGKQLVLRNRGADKDEKLSQRVCAPWSAWYNRALPGASYDDGTEVERVVILGLPLPLCKKAAGGVLVMEQEDAAVQTGLRMVAGTFCDARTGQLAVEGLRARTVADWVLTVPFAA